jgi:hypothetical protein
MQNRPNTAGVTPDAHIKVIRGVPARSCRGTDRRVRRFVIAKSTKKNHEPKAEERRRIWTAAVGDAVTVNGKQLAGLPNEKRKRADGSVSAEDRGKPVK